jgi:hypothetical protein
MSAAKDQDDKVHAEFSERCHLIRWCHDRSTTELRALKRAFEASKALKKKKGGNP